jgi:muramidase (phage lysozyme)
MSNIDAFLTMIAISEGTQPIGDRGYNCIVGSTVAKPVLFASYADHPRVHVRLRPDLISSAAGRYQILERYFDAYKAYLNLPDFSPDSQDRIALQMIHEQRAYADIEVGRFDDAIAKCSNIWASFPSACNSYGQHQNALADLRKAFTEAGGLMA